MSRARYNAYKFIAYTMSPYITSDEMVAWLKKTQPLDWEQVANISATHSVIQALYLIFLKKELITYIPDEFLAYAEHMHELNCERNEMMRKQLINAVLIMNNMGIQPLLMKGAAQLFLDTFENKGDRLLTDLDILVPADEIKPISEQFIAAGYEFSEEYMRFLESHHHYPPLIKQGECAAIELHHGLMFREQQHLFPTELAWQKAVDISLPNSAQAKVLQPSYRVLHSFLHSCLVDQLHQGGHVELRQLHELVRSYFAYASEINWQGIVDYVQKQGVAKQWYANLYMANKFMHMPELEKINNKYLLNSTYQYTRVCSKLRYDWFDTFDTRVVRRIKRYQSKAIALSQVPA